jgi:hypothetical protein
MRRGQVDQQCDQVEEDAGLNAFECQNLLSGWYWIQSRSAG